ncbi:MAG: hypothetical protein R2830_05285 [Saprospiraceae bacterium]
MLFNKVGSSAGCKPAGAVLFFNGQTQCQQDNATEQLVESLKAQVEHLKG